MSKPLTDLFSIDGGLSLMETNPRYKALRLTVSMDTELNFSNHKWDVSMEGDSLRLHVSFIDEEYRSLTGTYLIGIDGSVNGLQTLGLNDTEPEPIELPEIERLVDGCLNPLPDELLKNQTIKRFLALV
jgi:hypothetical protein